MSESSEIVSLETLIKNGGVFFNVKGERPEIVFKNILEKLSLPEAEKPAAEKAEAYSAPEDVLNGFICE